MKFVVPFLGKTKAAYIDEGIQDYAARLRRYAAVELPVLKDRHNHRESEEIIKLQEASVLRTQGESAGLRLALDPGGVQPDSEELARYIRQWEDRGVGSVCFWIGGHLGLHRSLLNQADACISLSRLTFTHEMSRLLLLEQLYRACTIKAGHNYHK